MMSIRNAFRLIVLIQNENTTYRELVEFLFGETPPEDHNFLARIDRKTVSEIVVSPAYHEDGNWDENPNPAASIGFIVHFPFHYYIYKNIYPYLPESEFILDAQWIRRNVEDWPALLQAFVNFLQHERVHFRIFRSPEDAEKFFEKYQLLVSNGPTPVLNLACNTGKRKVRVMYGHSKDLWNFGAWSRHFDLVLTYGPHSHTAISRYTKSVIVGNARFDDWFWGAASDRAQRIRERLNPSKKTILYLPTYGDLGSFELIADVMPQLLEHYNVMIKPHQITLYSERERLAQFRAFLAGAPRSANILWFDDFQDLVGLLAAADVVVSDNSGAIFDALLLDKPTVLLDFLDEEFFERKMWAVRKRGKDSWFFPLTYAGSIEQRIKNEKHMMVGEVVRTIHELPAAIERTLDRNVDHARNAERIRATIFSFCDGTAGRRSAAAIRELLSGTPTKKTLPALQVEAEVLRQTSYLLDEITSLQNILKSYLNLKPFYQEGQNLTSILLSVVIPVYNAGGLIEDTLRALISQTNLKPKEFEVIVVNDGSIDNTAEVLRKFIAENPETRVCALSYGRNRGAAFARNIGILFARGEFVAFTDADCTVPPDWLENFKRYFEENPEIAGAGGWYRLTSRGTSEVRDAVWHYLDWRTLPHTLIRTKSPTWIGNYCGNTANVCYRRSALVAAGGFNYYFPAATNEDWELKLRMHKMRFSLLYVPQMVIHRKPVSFSRFVQDQVLRGFANYLLFKLHPTFRSYNFSGWNGVWLTIQEIERILTSAHGYVPLHITQRVLFMGAAVVVGFYKMIGKYWIALQILSEQEVSLKSRQKI